MMCAWATAAPACERVRWHRDFLRAGRGHSRDPARRLPISGNGQDNACRISGLSAHLGTSDPRSRSQDALRDRAVTVLCVCGNRGGTSARSCQLISLTLPRSIAQITMIRLLLSDNVWRRSDLALPVVCLPGTVFRNPVIGMESCDDSRMLTYSGEWPPPS